MNLRRMAPAFILAGVTLILAAYLCTTAAALDRIASQNTKDRLDSLLALLQGSVDSARNGAEARAEMICAIPGVTDALASGDREKLLSLSGPPMMRAKVKLGMDQAHFANVDGKMILRIHHPDKFGDDVRKKFLVLTSCLDRGENISGVEISSAGPVVYGAAPIQQNGKTVGCFEVGVPFNVLIDNLKRVHGIDAAALFDERMLMDAADGDHRTSETLGKYARVYSSDWAVIVACLKGRALEGTAPSTYPTRFEGSEYGVALLPVADAKGRTIGWLVACRDFHDAPERIRRTLAVDLFLTFLAVVMVWGVVRVVVNGMILRPIVGLTGAIGHAASMDEYTARRDEIGDLARRIREVGQP